VGTLTAPAERNAMLPLQDTEIDTKRAACYLMKVETGSSLRYELDSMKCLYQVVFGENHRLVA